MSRIHEDRTDRRNLPAILLYGAQFLEEHGIENARLEADWLLAHCLGLGRSDLYLDSERTLSSGEVERFQRLLSRRGDGEPLQLILGHAEFYGRRFLTAPGVFIPRPETEGIIEIAARVMPEGGFPRVLDVGCGSGVIGLTLLLEGIARRVTAVDLSSEAVNLTGRNAAALGVVAEGGVPTREDAGEDEETRGRRRATRDDTRRSMEDRVSPAVRENSRQGVLSDCRLTLVTADAFSERFRPPGALFDLVVSNPPYVREDEWAELPREVRMHDPREALLSGEDGLEAHWSLARALPGWLGPQGLFLAEFGEEQGGEVRTLHEAWSVGAEIFRDLAGRDRYVLAGPPRPRCG